MAQNEAQQGPCKRRFALQDLSWPEFRERLTDKPTIILPLGSQEQQGPHAPMGDFVLAELIALAAAERADAICAPVLPFGYADFFRGAAGGIQLRASTFTAILQDMIVSFLDHGVTRIVICNGHSTNGPLIAQVLHTIRREHGVSVASVNLWRMLTDDLWRELHGPQAAQARGHGADPVTSAGLHLTPWLMEMDKAERSQRSEAFGLPTTPLFSGVEFAGFEIALPLDVSEVASNGVGSGDASLASPEAGARLTDWLAGSLAEFIRHFARCDPTDPACAPATK